MQESLSRKKKNRRQKLIFRLLCLTAAVVIVLAYYFAAIYNPYLVVSVIDVGQGDAAYIRTPDNYRVLLDGGDAGSFEGVLQDFLIKNGAFRLDAAIVSHYHSDHAAGIEELMKSSVPVEKLYLPDTDEEEEIKSNLLAAAEQKGTEVIFVSGGDTIPLSSDAEFQVFLPDEAIFPNDEGNENDNSLLMKLNYGEAEFLFTGDLETDAEYAIPNDMDIQADVLKVGHHGSETSTSEDFLSRVNPKAAVISVGENNRYGHPHREVTQRLEARVPQVYRTDIQGTVTFTADKENMREIKVSR